MQDNWYKRAKKVLRKSNNRSLSATDMGAEDGSVSPSKISSIISDESIQVRIYKGSKRLQQIIDEISAVKEFHQRYEGESQTQSEVRCIKHHTSIIIYCLHDRQLLCPNCVFSDNIHKKHRVIQAVKATAQIDKDLQKYGKPLGARDVNILESVRRWQDLVEKMNKVHQKTQSLLEAEHERAQVLLSTIYRNTKDKLQDAFDYNVQAINSLTSTLQNMRRCLKYEQSNPSIRQIYLQNLYHKGHEWETNQVTIRLGEQLLGQFQRQCVTYQKAMANTTQSLKR